MKDADVHIVPDDDILRRGNEFLSLGEWEVAYRHFESAIRFREIPEAYEKLGWAAWWLNKPSAAFDALERSYQLYSERNDLNGAARTAVWLARSRIEFKSEYAIANGWLQRARTHLEGLEGTSEYGWLLLFEGHLALMGKKDTTTSRAHAQMSIAIGRTIGDTDIEMWGRALDGLTLVIQGDVLSGMQQLDEAGAIGIGGEAKDLNAVAAMCCYMIHACERIQDHERAAQWYERIKEICRRWRFSALFAVCRSQYAYILLSKGKWREAEAELVSARNELAEFRPSLVTFCDLRIAELRRRRGNFTEAIQLFKKIESHPLSLMGLGSIALAQGDAVAAQARAERYLRRVPPNDPIERIPGLELLLRAQVSEQLIGEAGITLSEMLRIAELIPINCIKGIVAFAAGYFSHASDELDTARQQFEDAVDHFQRAGMPYDEARSRFQLATVLNLLERPQHAQAELQTAREIFGGLGASYDEQQCLSSLRTVLRETSSLIREALLSSGLTRREAEILTLIAGGKDNREIAEKLFVSVRTVEHHISSIYQKIGASGKSARAAAVSFAIKSGIVHPA